MNYDHFLPAFCGIFESQGLTKPCTNGDYVFATNAHIAIKVPKSKLLGSYEIIEKYPDVQKCFDDAMAIYTCDQTIDISKVIHLFDAMPRVPKYESCENCNGSGRYICFECSKEHKCGYCNGKGHSDTQIGTQLDMNTRFKMGQGIFLAKTFEPILKISREIAEPLQIKANSEMGATVIKCNDVDMIIMPNRDETADYELRFD
jgi:hypothetical protein